LDSKHTGFVRIQKSEYAFGTLREQESEEMRQPAKTFQNLIVWQKAHQFVLLVYQFTGHFPKSETYGLTSRVERAAISIPANIAAMFEEKRSSSLLYVF